MKMNLISNMGLIIIGILTGWVSWNTSLHGFCILPLVVVACFLLPGRSFAFLFMLSYYLGSTVELFWGAITFFDGNITSAACLWFSQQLILASAWVILRKNNWHGFTEIFLQIAGTILISVFIPPYCLLGIANPITAAGRYFPSTGFVGLGLYILMITAIVYLLSGVLIEAREKIGLIFMLTGILIAAFFLNETVNIKNSPLNYPQDWVGVNTRLGRYPLDDYQKIYIRHLKLKAIAEDEIRKGKKVIIFPESIAGFLTKTEKKLWQDIDWLAKKKKASILLGSYLPVSQNSYDNVLFVIGTAIPNIPDGIVARISMPVTNWRLFLKPSAGLHIGLAHDGVFTIDGRNAAFLICYEQMLVWPFLQSMSGVKKVDLIVTVSNIWWANNTKIPKIMDRTCRVWGRLFNVSVLRVINI